MKEKIVIKNQVSVAELKNIRLKLLKKQKYKCLICNWDFKDDIKNNSKNIHVDHDHETGLIRAALCRRCNTMEGKLYNCYKRMTKRDLKSPEDKTNVYKGLSNYISIKPTEWIHPTFGKVKKRKKKCKKKKVNKAK